MSTRCVEPRPSTPTICSHPVLALALKNTPAEVTLPILTKIPTPHPS